MATVCLISDARENMMQPVGLWKRFPLRSPNLLIFPYLFCSFSVFFASNSLLLQLM